MIRHLTFTSLVLLSIASIGCPSGGRGGGGGAGDNEGDPTVVVELPTASGEYYADVPVPLRAVASDDEDEPGQLAVRWLIDGQVEVDDVVPDSSGVAQGVMPLLASGSWTITTQVEDSDGNRSSVSTDIVVGGANQPPVCAIVSPAPGGIVAAAVGHVFEGTASDPEDDSDLLTLELSVNGVTVGSGSVDSDGTWAAEARGLLLGSSTVDLVVRDSAGGECETSVQVTGSNPPSVVIEFPTANGRVNQGSDQPFLATVIDQQDSEPSLDVVWSSDLDGVLGITPPTTLGAVVLEDVDLSAGAHLITLEATDSDGLVGRASVSVTLNAAPGAPTVSINPPAPGAESNLSVVIDVEAVDPEGDAVTYTWQWYRNGALESFFDDGTLPSTQTNRGETWTVEVRAVDDLGAISPIATASVTIANAIPTVTPPSITPVIAYANSTLSCSPGSTFDGDGDPVTLDYEWYINGTFWSAGQTLAPNSAARGQSVTCTSTPYDGLSYGAPATSGAVTILNGVPGAPGVSINPAQPESFDTLVCSVSAPSVDPDSDFVLEADFLEEDDFAEFERFGE